VAGHTAAAATEDVQATVAAIPAVEGAPPLSVDRDRFIRGAVLALLAVAQLIWLGLLAYFAFGLLA